jgi:hypothetical protein
MTQKDVRFLRPLLPVGLVVTLTGCCHLFWTAKCPPEITKQPESQIATVGYTGVTFTVVANPPGVRYQWKRNGVLIPGATNSFYEIPHAITMSDLAEYGVTASNPVGSVESQPAFLSINSTNLIRGNSGTLTGLIGSFHNTNNSCVGSAAGFDRYNVYQTFEGPGFTAPLPRNFPNNDHVAKLTINTCNAANAPGNVTAVEIIKNSFVPIELCCSQTGNCTAPSPGLAKCGPVALPTGTTATSGSCRVVIYYKSTSLAPGQTAITFDWIYTVN